MSETTTLPLNKEHWAEQKEIAYDLLEEWMVENLTHTQEKECRGIVSDMVIAQIMHDLAITCEVMRVPLPSLAEIRERNS